MNKEKKAALIAEIKKHLEEARYKHKPIDIDFIEKEHKKIRAACKAIDRKNSGVCVHFCDNIQILDNCFLPLLKGKDPDDIMIDIDRGGSEYIEVKVKGISEYWFCLIKKNWFMSGM